MASDETMMMSTIQDEDFEDDDHTHQYHHNLSRLSVCTSSTICGVDEDVDNLASMCMSNLSIESFEADGGDGDDADVEFSDDGKDDRLLLQTGLSSGSENESGSCYSLPATPPRRRSLIPATTVGVKDYASENEVRKETNSNDLGKSSSRRRRRRSLRSVFERGNSWENLWDQKKKMKEKENGVNSGESDHGVMVITRPKGGNRSDDPRDVKARLKVWAQAVAIASATKYGS
ncbi:hypothetical protein TSUD_343590 [Trifolium subterraneum]|nr:hypothetical protein TSUD_343590 [Trifolium subterraneum]